MESHFCGYVTEKVWDKTRPLIESSYFFNEKKETPITALQVVTILRNKFVHPDEHKAWIMEISLCDYAKYINYTITSINGDEI